MNTVTILQGDVKTKLRELPDNSVHCVVTSPPYWGLRDYGVEGQLGLEKTIEEYVEKMVETFREVRRVLRKDGTLWLNLGDSYSGGKIGRTDHGTCDPTVNLQGNTKGAHSPGPVIPRKPSDNLKPKDLCMIPARVALALQADGWWLRSKIIWNKPNPMPESCKDRPTNAYEEIFLLTKSARYFYDQEAVREGEQVYTRKAGGYKNHSSQMVDDYSPYKGKGGFADSDVTTVGRNLRNVWTISTHAYPEAHFATFPPSLPEKCIKAGTSEKGVCPQCGAPWVRVVKKPIPPKEVFTKTVKPDSSLVNRGFSAEGGKRGSGQKYQNWLNGNPAQTTGWRPSCKCPEHQPIPATVFDPFLGSGTTCLVAANLGRDSIGIELKPEYVEMAKARIKKELGFLVEIKEG